MSFTIKTVIAVLPAWILLSASCRDTHKEIHLSDLRGTWINESYFDIVTRTKSPLRGFKSTNLLMPYVDIQDSIVGFTPNFHEGASIVVENFHRIDSSDFYEFSDQGMTLGISATHRLRMRSDNMLDWTIAGQDTSIHYVFIRSTYPFEQWLNRQVVVGNYRDSAGNKFSFSDSGLANWPSRSFKYAVQTDFVLGLQHRDNIIDFDRYDSVGHRYLGYAFAWNGDTLVLFDQSPFDPNIDNGIEERFEDKPCISLITMR